MVEETILKYFGPLGLTTPVIAAVLGILAIYVPLKFRSVDDAAVRLATRLESPVSIAALIVLLAVTLALISPNPEGCNIAVFLIALALTSHRKLSEYKRESPVQQECQDNDLKQSANLTEWLKEHSLINEILEAVGNQDRFDETINEMNSGNFSKAFRLMHRSWDVFDKTIRYLWVDDEHRSHEANQWLEQESERCKKYHHLLIGLYTIVNSLIPLLQDRNSSYTETKLETAVGQFMWAQHLFQKVAEGMSLDHGSDEFWRLFTNELNFAFRSTLTPLSLARVREMFQILETEDSVFDSIVEERLEFVNQERMKSERRAHKRYRKMIEKERRETAGKIKQLPRQPYRGVGSAAWEAHEAMMTSFWMRVRGD